MADLDALDHALSDLLSRCSPAASRAALREIMRGLQQRNRERMAANIDPDGKPYAPRRPQRIRDKKGRIRMRTKRGAMFRKLRNTTQIKISDGVGTLDFRGSPRIPEAHHFGLVDRVRAGLSVAYTARPLIGISEADHEYVRDVLLKHLSNTS